MVISLSIIVAALLVATGLGIVGLAPSIGGATSRADRRAPRIRRQKERYCVALHDPEFLDHIDGFRGRIRSDLRPKPLANAPVSRTDVAVN